MDTKKQQKRIISAKATFQISSCRMCLKVLKLDGKIYRYIRHEYAFIALAETYELPLGPSSLRHWY